MKVPKTYLNKFREITEECTAIVQVAVTVNNKFFIDDPGKERYLVPLRVLDMNKSEELVEILEEENGDKIDIEEIYPFMITATLWEDKVSSEFDLPIKGESVIATFEYNELDKLTCTGIVTIAKLKPPKFNLLKNTYNHV